VNILEMTILSRKLRLLAALCCGLALVFSASAQEDDWIGLQEAVPGGGTIEFEFPEEWGKKPSVDALERVTSIQFGPYGPKKKPVFLVRVEAVTAEVVIHEEALKMVAEAAVAEHKLTAAETTIPVNDLHGPSVSGHYFSITDRESKRGEFDYLTLAILGSGHLAIRVYFFSSDGAPDFGADAMQMMQSINYTAPPPEPEAEKK
jgi:hypothetical protein